MHTGHYVKIVRSKVSRRTYVRHSEERSEEENVAGRDAVSNPSFVSVFSIKIENRVPARSGWVPPPEQLISDFGTP